MKKTRIGIYGGSFNPVHYGHLKVAQSALEKLALDRLIIMPAAVSPFKVGSTAAEVFGDRMENLKAVFGGLEKCEVDDRELRRGGVSYAIDTVREIHAENPDCELFFIIGEDSVEGLPRWKEIEELKRLCTFVPFPRTKESSSELRQLFEAGEVTINPEEKLASMVREGVRRKGGFCPCRLPRTPEFFCPCEEFRAQLADPAFHGLCHCRLYLKK